MGNLWIRTKVNGETVQDSNTGNMIFKPSYLISHISKLVHARSPMYFYTNSMLKYDNMYCSCSVIVMILIILLSSCRVIYLPTWTYFLLAFQYFCRSLCAKECGVTRDWCAILLFSFVFLIN